MTSREEGLRYALCSGHNEYVLDGGNDNADDDLAVVEGVFAKFLDPAVAKVGF